MNDTLSGQGHTRPEPWYFGNFLRCPQSAYVQYASIVRLVNYRNIYGQGQRVGKKSIFVPARRLIDAYWTYAEGKQRNRGKNWLFSDRVSLCPLRVRKHDIKVVPEPTKGSNTILSWSENPKTSLSIKSVGNWHGCGVRSLAERWYPVVTFAISHTSDGFFPSVLTRSLPFFWNWDILHFYPVWHPNEMYIPLDFSHTTIFFHSAGSNSFYRQLQPNNSIQFPDSGKEVFYPTINKEWALHAHDFPREHTPGSATERH